MPSAPRATPPRWPRFFTKRGAMLPRWQPSPDRWQFQGYWRRIIETRASLGQPRPPRLLIPMRQRTLSSSPPCPTVLGPPTTTKAACYCYAVPAEISGRDILERVVYGARVHHTLLLGRQGLWPRVVTRTTYDLETGRVITRDHVQGMTNDVLYRALPEAPRDIRVSFRFDKEFPLSNLDIFQHNVP